MVTGTADSASHKPALVLLHGWAAHAKYYAPLVAALDWPVVYVPDLPGHGTNKANIHAHSIGGITEWLHEHLQLQGLDKPVLFGWSMGAMVALEYVQRYGSEAVSGLVIEDMTPRLLNDADWQLGLDGGFNAEHNRKAVGVIANDWPRYAAGVSSRFIARGASLHDNMQWIAEDLRNNDSDIMACLWQSMAEQDYRPLLPSITVPVLVISGGKSQLYSPATAEYFAANIPQATVVICQNSGHAPHLEETAKVAEAVGQFMAPLVLP